MTKNFPVRRTGEGTFLLKTGLLGEKIGSEEGANGGGKGGKKVPTHGAQDRSLKGRRLWRAIRIRPAEKKPYKLPRLSREIIASAAFRKKKEKYAGEAIVHAETGKTLGRKRPSGARNQWICQPPAISFGEKKPKRSG